MKIYAVVTAFVLASLPFLAWNHSAPATLFIRAARVIGLGLGVVLLVFYAINLERDVSNLPRPGDLDVYLRAAWAAREGTSIYQTTDQHGWHYIYPPLLATLLIPFADPPEDATAGSKVGTIPYWVSASIWYWIGIGCLLASIQMIATALEDYGVAHGAPAPPAYSQSWWSARLIPLLLTLYFTLDGLNRGQVTQILLLCLSAGGVSILRGRSFRAGLWVGAAAAIKLFPGFLLVYALWRRDKRFLAGVAVAIGVGFLLPVVIMGPSAGLTAYRDFAGTRVLPEASGGGDPALAKELRATNSRIQSFEYMVYDTLHPIREARAAEPPYGYLLAHMAIAVLLTGGVLWVMRRPGDRLAEFLFFAALALLAVPILPFSRPHDYAFGVLPLAGLYAAEWQSDGGPRWPIAIAAIAFLAASILDTDNQTWALEFGLATYASLALAGLALWAARRRPTAEGRPVAGL